MSKLTFNGFEFNVIQHSGQPYLTLQEIAQVLYAKEGGPQSATPLHEFVICTVAMLTNSDRT